MRSGYRDDPETGGFEGERVFSSRVDLRYVVEEGGRPDMLVVAFAAVHLPDETPRYYTHRVLRAVPCHRLFVLDDHGPREPLPRPAWYLGRDRSFDVADSVVELMGEVADELGVDRRRVVTCGGSKGGWAALYFAARFGAGHALAGEPQVFLGKHLLQEENYGIARHVAGGTSPEDGEFLDAVLFDALRESDAPPAMHLYCGRGSPYYERDVMPLVRFLEERRIAVDLELGDHSQHVPDLGLHFPGYLTRRLAALLKDPAAAAARPSSPPGPAPS